MNQSLVNIFHELEKAYISEKRIGGNEAAIALSEAQANTLVLKETDTAPKPLIEKAVKQPQALSVSLDIQICCPYFKWEKWGEDVLDKKVSANIYTTELIGPDGLLKNSELRIGLLVSAAETDYPLSSHAGEETYFIISGTAEWIIEGQPYREISPGSLVHHPSRKPHGRRTNKEVFLGAWRWSGDLDLDSFQVDND